ncbi:MAG: FkbM family methyltransferase [Albidovulum sp.]
MECDLIQRTHRQGRFYEQSELWLIRRHFPVGGCFVDIGANVGNHSLFVAMFCAASVVVPVEPNPEANNLLIANVLVNGLGGVFDVNHLGLAFGEHASTGNRMEERDHNLGAARLLPTGGTIDVVRGDDILRDYAPAFIKVDVEGMELDVLRGLENTLARHRPTLFVEVNAENAGAFFAWAKANTYQSVHSVDHKKYVNHLLKPIGAT